MKIYNKKSKIRSGRQECVWACGDVKHTGQEHVCYHFYDKLWKLYFLKLWRFFEIFQRPLFLSLNVAVVLLFLTVWVVLAPLRPLDWILATDMVSPAALDSSISQRGCHGLWWYPWKSPHSAVTKAQKIILLGENVPGKQEIQALKDPTHPQMNYKCFCSSRNL